MILSEGDSFITPYFYNIEAGVRHAFISALSRVITYHGKRAD